jgi:hypothetical protein
MRRPRRLQDYKEAQVWYVPEGNVLLACRVSCYPGTLILPRRVFTSYIARKLDLPIPDVPGSRSRAYRLAWTFRLWCSAQLDLVLAVFVQEGGCHSLHIHLVPKAKNPWRSSGSSLSPPTMTSSPAIRTNIGPRSWSTAVSPSRLLLRFPELTCPLASEHTPKYRAWRNSPYRRAGSVL